MGVGRSRGSRVQIPLSPFLFLPKNQVENKKYKKLKKVVDKRYEM